MTIRYIRVCDKCKGEVDDKDQLWAIKILPVCYSGAHAQDTFDSSPTMKLDVCRPCLESFGINVTTKPNVPVKPHPTIVEAIQEMIDISLANQGAQNG